MDFSSICYFTFQRNPIKLAYVISFLFYLFCNRTRNVCYGHEHVLMCQDTALKVMAPPLEQGILVRKDLGQEVQGCVCSSCFVEEEILILLCQQKTVNDFFWSFIQRPLDCWTHICTTIHRIMSACNIH